jgi:hypothetical protein
MRMTNSEEYRVRAQVELRLLERKGASTAGAPIGFPTAWTRGPRWSFRPEVGSPDELGPFLGVVDN